MAAVDHESRKQSATEYMSMAASANGQREEAIDIFADVVVGAVVQYSIRDAETGLTLGGMVKELGHIFCTRDKTHGQILDELIERARQDRLKQGEKP